MSKKLTQVVLGKGFEYACALAIVESVQNVGGACVLEESPQQKTAKDAYENKFPASERRNSLKAAQAGVKLLLSYEPHLVKSCGNEPLYVSLQSDKHGQEGDVRDILCIRKQNGWTMGISCKHNHDALKHPRLSQTIDFGNRWFNIPCSEAYFDEIRPVFETLQRIKTESNKKAEWSSIKNKANKFYEPVLKAFKEELQRLNESHPHDVPKALMSYLIGRQDFYKIIALKRIKRTKVQAFNLYGTLNKRAGKNRADAKVHLLHFPERILEVRFAKDKNKKEKKNTLEILFDNGWLISLRIHNASTNVAPSLKFDVRLKSHGTELENCSEQWES